MTATGARNNAAIANHADRSHVAIRSGDTRAGAGLTSSTGGGCVVDAPSATTSRGTIGSFGAVTGTDTATGGSSFTTAGSTRRTPNADARTTCRTDARV